MGTPPRALQRPPAAGPAGYLGADPQVVVGDEFGALAVARVEPGVEGAEGHAGERQQEGQGAPSARWAGGEAGERRQRRPAPGDGEGGDIARGVAGSGRNLTHLPSLRGPPWPRWQSPYSGPSQAAPLLHKKLGMALSFPSPSLRPDLSSLFWSQSPVEPRTGVAIFKSLLYLK